MVIEFDDASADTIKEFQAVHLGTVTVTITPTDTSYDPVTVDVTIQNPTQLGQTYNTFDTQIISLANIRGIPPQYIKGQIQQESGFNPYTYRYEPLGSDLYMFGPKPIGRNLRTTAPYSGYRLATDDLVPDLNSEPWPTPLANAAKFGEGADTIPADISPRFLYAGRPGYRMCAQGYTLGIWPQTDSCVGGNTVPIPESDSPPLWLSAREILYVNDGQQNWLANANAATWQTLVANPSALFFTAQTDLAASYGLLHILYPTAVLVQKVTGFDGPQNPSLLFDTAAGIAAGTSSLPLGTGYLANTCFSAKNPAGLSSDPVLNGSIAFAGAFAKTFNYYNHNSATGTYGTTVVNTNAALYAPTPSAPIFQGP